MAMEAVLQDDVQSVETENVDVKTDNVINSVHIQAVDKLNSELKNAKSKDFARPVIEHLIQRCQEDEGLAEDVLKDDKTWSGCYSYIYKQARAMTNGNQLAVQDYVVFEWAEDYYRQGDSKKSGKGKAKSGASRSGAKQTASAAKTAKPAVNSMDNEKNAQKTEENAKKLEEHPQITKGMPENSAAKTQQKKPKKQQKSSEPDGQMSIFDLM